MILTTETGVYRNKYVVLGYVHILYILLRNGERKKHGWLAMSHNTILHMLSTVELYFIKKILI